MSTYIPGGGDADLPRRVRSGTARYPPSGGGGVGGGPSGGPPGGGGKPPRGPEWWRRLSLRKRRAARVALALTAAACALLGGLVAYAAATLPDVNQIGAATNTIKLLDRNGAPIGEYGSDNTMRHTVPIAQISQILQQATVATEDRNFYNEGAINFGRVTKALFVDVLAGHAEQGASTITQQLAKLAFFGPNAGKSPLRKLREALLANELDRMYSKDQILEKYLNIIYYGHGATGIEDASQTYFGKDAKALDLREASMLAGLPQAPSNYDPYLNLDDALARQHTVLASLVDAGDVTQDQADAVDATVGTPDQQAANKKAMQAELSHGHQTGLTQLAPHFAEYVREHLTDLFADDPAALSGNITVTTTLDAKDQGLANTAVSSGVKAMSSQGANNGALLMMDSHSGDILAMVGSANFDDDSIAGQYNVVTGERRPGSSFKPYVYETGFMNGTLTPGTILQDTKAEAAKYGGVHDFDGAYEGNISAAKALLDSRNIPTEEAMDKSGVQDVIDFAHSLGISSDLAANTSTGIGTSAVKMIDHTAAYAAFSNGGTTVTPRAILKVTDDDTGDVLYDAGQPAQGNGVMQKAQADAITRILVNYPKRWSLNYKHQVAAKSGTTDDFVDAWLMSYTPDFVVATWAGHTDQTGAEIGMSSVFGTEVGKDISVPFVNSLPGSLFHGFQLSTDTLDCGSGGGAVNQSGCPTPTPSPTPEPTPTPSPSPSETPSPTPGLPIIGTLPPLLPTPTPCATGTPGVPTLPPVLGTPIPTPTPTGCSPGG